MSTERGGGEQYCPEYDTLGFALCLPRVQAAGSSHRSTQSGLAALSAASAPASVQLLVRSSRYIRSLA